jgi:hypothetical protein
MSAALPYVWDGAALHPLPAFANAAGASLPVGGVVAMAPAELRSPPSHRHYFACVREAWVNLPEEHAARFASDEHLRKYALIKSGYRDERSIVCASKAEARRIAAFIRPTLDYAVVLVEGPVIIQFTEPAAPADASGPACAQRTRATRDVDGGVERAFPEMVTLLSPVTLSEFPTVPPKLSNVEFVTDTPELRQRFSPPRSFTAVGSEPSNSMFEKLTLLEVLTLA